MSKSKCGIIGMLAVLLAIIFGSIAAFFSVVLTGILKNIFAYLGKIKKKHLKI